MTVASISPAVASTAVAVSPATAVAAEDAAVEEAAAPAGGGSGTYWDWRADGD